MNIKQFIKPTIWKISVAFVLFLLMFFAKLFPTTITTDCSMETQAVSCPPPITQNFQISLFSKIDIINDLGLNGKRVLLIAGYILVYLIIAYLVSCLIFTPTKK